MAEPGVLCGTKRIKCGQSLLLPCCRLVLPWFRSLDLLEHRKSPLIEVNAMPFFCGYGCCSLLALLSSFRRGVVLQGFSRHKSVLPCIYIMRLQALAVSGASKLHSSRLLPHEASGILAQESCIGFWVRLHLLSQLLPVTRAYCSTVS